MKSMAAADYAVTASAAKCRTSGGGGEEVRDLGSELLPGRARREHLQVVLEPLPRHPQQVAAGVFDVPEEGGPAAAGRSGEDRLRLGVRRLEVGLSTGDDRDVGMLDDHLAPSLRWGHARQQISR
nr:hypothetical protein [Pseudonocardia sp. KRD291]